MAMHLCLSIFCQHFGLQATMSESLGLTQIFAATLLSKGCGNLRALFAGCFFACAMAASTSGSNDDGVWGLGITDCGGHWGDREGRTKKLNLLLRIQFSRCLYSKIVFLLEIGLLVLSVAFLLENMVPIEIGLCFLLKSALHIWKQCPSWSLSFFTDLRSGLPIWEPYLCFFSHLKSGLSSS